MRKPLPTSRARHGLVLCVALAAGCGAATEHDALDGASLDASASPDAASSPDAPASLDASTALDATDCRPGERCAPIEVRTFPFADARDTRTARSRDIASYGCAPDISEAGPEVYYRITLPARGLLTARVTTSPGDTTDVDVQLLSALDPAACLARDNTAVARVLDAGEYYLVVDTWADASGMEYPGPYDLAVDFRTLNGGPCAMDALDQRMYWSACAPGIDCYEAMDPSDGNTYRYLRTPTLGPVVMEAHLVTVDEDFGGGWPTSFTDQITRHYGVSESVSGFSTTRTQPWAPAGEGGSQYGEGAYGRPLPVLDEAWYVNMYWNPRPPAGTRVIVFNPANRRAVVASGGYETGPGSNTAIGGAAEEIHRYLGTMHRDDLVMGFAADPTLPLGPIECGW